MIAQHIIKPHSLWNLYIYAYRFISVISMALRPLWTGSPAASPNAAVAGDHVESQPVEIMKVPVPSDPLPTSSPDIPSKLRREKYQGERKAEFEKEVATPATWVQLL